MLLTLKALIERRGLNQERLAEEMGWGSDKVSRYVHATRAIPTKAAFAIARHLRATPFLQRGRTAVDPPVFLFQPNSKKRKACQNSKKLSAESCGKN